MIFMFRPLFFLVASFFSFGFTGSFAEDTELPSPEHVQIRLYSTSPTIVPGEPITIIIEQLIEPGWHTYWKNPGDSGTPTNVKWVFPDGGKAGPLEHPIPRRIPYGPMVNFGYADRALFSTVVTPPETLPGDTFTITAEIDWLVCKEICLPEKGSYSLVLPVTSGTADVNYGITNILRDLTASHPVQTDWHVRYHDEGNQTIFSFTPSVQALQILNAGGKIEFFPEEWGVINNAAEQIPALIDRDRAALAIVTGDRERGAIPDVFRGLFVVYDDQGHAQGYETDVRSVVSAKGEIENKGLHREVKKERSKTGFVGAVILAFLGGIILNLMPCVFPVLSLKILSIAGLSGAEKEHLRLHGLAYAAGIVATFIFIAALLMMLQGTGAALGWGFQLQQPIVVALLSYLFVAIGFNLMGWFDVDLVRYIPARFHAAHDGLPGSFATGILATLVATPCTAPFMAAALGYALTHHPLIGLIVFCALGIGLSSPFVLLTFIPNAHKYLPRPGNWMIVLRQILAFPMFITAVWLIWVLGHQTGVDGVALALCSVVAMGLFLWVSRLAPKTPKGFFTQHLLQTGIILILCGLLFGQYVLRGSVSDEFVFHQENEVTFTPQALEEALKTDKPVFVNMTAAWCITCKVNERIALSNQAIKDFFKKTGMIYLKGDWTNYDADVTAYLNQFGRKGVPLYVFYPARDMAGLRPEAVVLPQILTPGLLASIFGP